MNDYRYGFRITTNRRIHAFENWLDNNCHGDYSIAIEGMDRAHGVKVISLLFEREIDKMAFYHYYCCGR